jgi:hypothetical protein
LFLMGIPWDSYVFFAVENRLPIFWVMISSP